MIPNLVVVIISNPYLFILVKTSHLSTSSYANYGYIQMLECM
jgi:hypothetical protein